ncbi:MAG: leucine-rich repeat domain-containing protein [Clostridia bacterium]|nr:leucine-rich repeat domain-containing protein [Clostridia bacterium]
MAITVLQLEQGLPYTSRKGYDNIEKYKFVPTTIDEKMEKMILSQAACWEFVCDKVEVYDHDDYGSYETPLGVDVTRLDQANVQYVIWNNQFIGVKYCDAVFFLPNGNHIGSYCQTCMLRSDSRHEVYERYTYSIRQIAPCSQVIYYEANNDNPYHTVYAIDPFVENIEIPEGVEEICDDTFINCKNLQSIKFPSTLKTIKFPGKLYFDKCPSLTSISVDTKNTFFQSKGNCLIENATKTLVGVLPNCVIPNDGSIRKITSFLFYHSPIKNIVIPNGVRTLCEYLFAYSELESIVLPKTITKIETHVFAYCKSLKIYYEGTKEDWENIKTKSFSHTSSLYYYSKQQPTTEGKYWHYNENNEITIW